MKTVQRYPHQQVQFRALYKTLSEQTEGDLEAGNTSIKAGSSLIVTGMLAAQDDPLTANASVGYGSGLMWAGINIINVVKRYPQRLLRGFSLSNFFLSIGISSSSVSSASISPFLAGLFLSTSLNCLYHVLKGVDPNSP